MTTRVLEFELTEAVPSQVDLNGAEHALVFLRYQGSPLGSLTVHCPEKIFSHEQLYQALDQDHELRDRFAYRVLTGWLLKNTPVQKPALPSWSVIICTRNRPDDLRRCLDSLLDASKKPALPPGEILVVDNAPSGPETAQLAAGYPVRYLREDRPGLNWARGHGARNAYGEVLLYTDDDVVVDENWILELLQPFDNPRTAAVTGLIMPLELETRAQELFELYGGFGRGYEKRIFDYRNITPTAAGYVGAGASMAIRQNLVIELRLFDAELDCGTLAQTGGDAYAFYQVLAAGYQIIYNPSALNWHRHRRDYASLRRTLAGYSVGGFAFLTRCLILHKDLHAILTGLVWLWSDHFKQLANVILRRERALPLDLVLAQFAGVPKGIRAYFVTRRVECRFQRLSSPEDKGNLLHVNGSRPPSGSPNSSPNPYIDIEKKPEP